MRSHYSCRSSLVADADNSASMTTTNTKNYYSQLSVSEIAYRGTATSTAKGATEPPTICCHCHNTTDTAKLICHHTTNLHHHLPPTLTMPHQQQRPLITSKMKQQQQQGSTTCFTNRQSTTRKPRKNTPTKLELILKKFRLTNQSMQIFLQVLIFCVASLSALEISQPTNNNHLLNSNGSHKYAQHNISSNNVVYKSHATATAASNEQHNKNSIMKPTKIKEFESDEYEDEDADSDVKPSNDDTHNRPAEVPPGYPLTHGTSYFGSCPSCGSHEDLKRVSLEFIKHRVLHKLGLDAPPNITVFPKVSETIIQNLLNPHGLTKPFTTTTNNYEMAGDDPTPYRDDSFNKPEIDDDEEDANYYSIIQRVIALPIKSAKLRHQKRAHQEILQFNFDNNSGVLEANLHVYLQGEQWLRRTHPELLRNIRSGTSGERNNVTITIHKIIRSNVKTAENKAYHKEETTFEGQLPTGEGEYIRINITSLVGEWFRDASSNHGMVVKMWGQLTQKVTVLEANEFTPFIEYEVDDKRKPRHKRSAHALNCDENDRESRCCRFPLTVDFEEFGWNWIIAPKKYDANYCSGECSLNFLPKYPHTHVWQLSNSASATPCCSPRKMSDLKLLYYDHNFNIVLSKIPSMIVETCNCS